MSQIYLIRYIFLIDITILLHFLKNLRCEDDGVVGGEVTERKHVLSYVTHFFLEEMTKQKI